VFLIFRLLWVCGGGLQSCPPPPRPGVRPWYCAWQKRQRCYLLKSRYFSMLHCLDIMHLPPSTPEPRNCRCDPWGKLLTITPPATIKIPQQASGREACLSNRFDTLLNSASVNIGQCLRNRCTYGELKKLLCCWKQNKCTNVSQTFLFALKSSYFGRKHLTHHQNNKNTVDLRLSGLIWTASHPQIQKIRIIEFFFENRLHWLFEVRLLLFTVRKWVWTLRSSLI
jgi:hypothetical protein